MSKMSVPGNIKIGVRRETREKFDAAREATRLPYVELADLSIDEFLKARGIKLDHQPRRRNSPPQPISA